ncbi:MAG: hypothetical protein ACREMF_02855 [Gemmatimonadales bacterium]
MAINYIPNDPLATCVTLRKERARQERGTGVARFRYVPHGPQGVYPPGTAGFLFWQSREAALNAVALFERLAGSRLRSWARSPSRKVLDLVPNAGIDLNAYYDGESISFFEHTTQGTTTYSGASTDVVAHEAGHALLDTIHPDLWFSSFTETNAFHEAFSDCIAILTALADRETRRRVAKQIRARNCVETTAEDLAAGVRRAKGPSHPAAKPRQAKNDYRWRLPTTLPPIGPPDLLTSEIHSFGRVFTGCFWDTFLNILGSGKTEKAIWTAARITGKLLVGAAAQAPESARFFQAVGRTMVLLDQSLHAGAHGQAIHDGFGAHGIALGSSGMLAPVAAVAGKAPALGRGRATVGRATLDDVRRRIGASPGARITVRQAVIGGWQAARLLHHREVSLSRLDRRLRGVVAIVPEPILVGEVDKTAAILGGLPEPHATADEVYAYVQSILSIDRIAFTGTGKRPLETPSAKARDQRRRLPTHLIRKEGEKRVLRRVRFACAATD